MIDHFFKNLWLWKCELPEETIFILPGPDELRKSQMSQEFIRLMENRMILGTFRYGDWHKQLRDYDRIGSAINRIEQFRISGNTEYLVDAANLLMIEFEVTKHPLKHFNTTDDGEHCNKK
jgi:hypothetical protein